MKSTPAVFLTSLAVSAISLATPIPAASTVLDLFIGEDITVHDTSNTPTECRHNSSPESGAADCCQENIHESNFSFTGELPLHGNRSSIVDKAISLRNRTALRTVNTYCQGLAWVLSGGSTA
ncbi:hypothetical protein [Pontibacter brevis]